MTLLPQYEVAHPAKGAPNVIVMMLDDLGFAQLGCFGSDISTPNIDALAHGGLRYNRFHVTALCSPTRAAVLTGRNHHRIGNGFLVDIPVGYPGYSARLPRSAGTMPRVLREAGYNTIAIGKWHLTPTGERSAAGPFDRWPLGFGFERYYGFLRAETNQWAPDLVMDNHSIDPPCSPDQGYHLTEDLVDQAIRNVYEQKTAAPNRPFFLYFAPGAMHAPHQVPPQWVEPYVGQFDDGWEAFRQRAFERQKADGIVPPDAEISERPSWVPEWSGIPAADRRVYSRMQELFAGFLSHTDAQIGRLVEFLRQIDQLDNTLIMFASDNGASAEGGLHGSINEHRYPHRLPDSVELAAQRFDDLGGFKLYNHYAWGWAWAGNTPFKLWKRYTWLGGVRTPLIVHWPDGFSSRNEVRSQFVHAVDLMPTVLDACGVTPPEFLDGERQMQFDGASIRPTFHDPAAPNPRDVQYFEMVGSRSLFADGWKATTNHVPGGVADEETLLEGSRDFAADQWLLYHVDEDFAEVRDLAAQEPERLKQMQERWTVEAAQNNVFPLFHGLLDRFLTMLPPPNTPPTHVVYKPFGVAITDEALPRLLGGFTITADVEIPDAGAEGVLYEIGDWNGGFALYVRDSVATYVLNRASDEFKVTAAERLEPGRRQIAVRYLPGSEPRLELLIDGREVGRVELPGGFPFMMQGGGTSMTLGYSTPFPVTHDYAVPSRWTGTLHEVVIDTMSDALDHAEHIRGALHLD